MLRTPVEDEFTLVRRAWTRAERRVVLHGLLGRFLITLEPLICFAVFAALTACLVFLRLPPSSHLSHKEAAIILAPIFGLAAAAFFAYAAFVLVAPIRALVQTFSPIYKIDGYMRYRPADEWTLANSNGYIAVLAHDQRIVAEWPSIGHDPLPDLTCPAHVEFSFYGGVHRIDGRSTGILPESVPLAGIGMKGRRL
ncbi:MAG: hypothetical protein ACREM2_07240 [Vulcanimicrobiaceae bacterium]